MNFWQSFNPKVFASASTTDQALAQVDAWPASPQVSVLHSGQQSVAMFCELSRKAKYKSGQFHDAHTAAICLKNFSALNSCLSEY